MKNWTAAILAASWLIGGYATAEEASVPIADCHCHLLDFLQNGDVLVEGKISRPRPGDALPVGKRHARLEMVLGAMDEANVSRALISGMPFLKRWSANTPWRPGYYLDSTSRLVLARDTDYVIANAIEDWRREDPERFNKEFGRLYPSICAVEITDMNSVDRIVKLAREFPGIWKAVGEVFSRHDDASNLTTGERPRANHPAMKRIADLCAQFDIPVWIHHNLAPISRGTTDTGHRYLDELIDLYESCPDTKFIHCHAGVSRRIIIGDLIEIHRRILKAFPHVTVDLSWVVFEQEIIVPNRFDTYEDPVIKRGWIELIEQYPDRFMIGSDKVGSFAGYKKEIRKWDALLKHLKEETRLKLAHENFNRIMPEKGLTIPDDYYYPEHKFVPGRKQEEQRSKELEIPPTKTEKERAELDRAAKEQSTKSSATEKASVVAPAVEKTPAAATERVATPVRNGVSKKKRTGNRLNGAPVVRPNTEVLVPVPR